MRLLNISKEYSTELDYVFRSHLDYTKFSGLIVKESVGLQCASFLLNLKGSSGEGQLPNLKGNMFV